MQVTPSVASVLTITDAAGVVDPITVILQDISPGKGSMLVECYGQSWSHYWNAMGDNTVRQFVAACGIDYILDKMSPGKRMTRVQEKHFTRIMAVVHAACMPSAGPK